MPGFHKMRAVVVILAIAAVASMPLNADTVLRRTTLLVNDLERSAQFYSKLGLKSYYDAEKSLKADGAIIGGEDLPLAGEPTESRIVILVGPEADSGMLGLLAYSAPPLSEDAAELDGLGRGDVVLMFNVDDIQAVHQALAAAGAQFHREPYPFEVRDNEGALRASGWRMFVYDPDGHLIEVAQKQGADTAIAATSSEVIIRRKFVDYRYGQLHLREAQPAQGPVSRPALLLFHQTPLSGRLYDSVLPLLAKDRVVYAVDTPGYGESDPPPRPLSIEEYAAAISDFVATIPGPVDVMGYHTGVLLSMELARTLPEKVRRAVLVSIPLFSDDVRSGYQPNRKPIDSDGSYLEDMWRSSLKARAEGQSLERIAEIVAEKQRAGTRSWWSGPAIFAYDTRARLGEIRQPALVLAPGDTLKQGTIEAAVLLPDASLLDLPDLEYGFFDTHPEQIAKAVLEFLNS